jgi:hypothetical protein
MTKLEELRAKREELKAQITEESKAFFKAESASLFDRFPKLESFGWTQYTPYFNDGEECVFSVNNDYISVNGDDEAEGRVKPTYEWAKPPEPNPKYDADIAEMYPVIQSFVRQFTDEDMKEMFGDHCAVTVTRTGVEVESYEHD